MRRRWFARRLVDLVVLFMLVASVAKLYDLPAFADSLATWRYVPRSLITPIAFGLPLVELTLALFWFLRLSPRVAVVGIALLLVTFTGFYLYQTRDTGPPPDCGCLGKILRYEAQQSAIFGLVARNTTLFVLIVAGAWFGGVFRMQTVQDGGSTFERGRDGRTASATVSRAFTLVELVLVIGIIGLLISLLLPAIGGVYERARGARTLANLRTHATAMASYTADWDDQFLAMTDPAKDITTVEVGGREYRLSYWSPTIVWPLGLLDAYYDGQMTNPSLMEDDEGVAQPWGNWAYEFSASFLARPEFWNRETREGVNQLGPTRLGEVLYPSRKGIFVVSADLPGSDYQARQLDRRWRIGFVDTSARSVLQRDLNPGYATGEGDYGSGGGTIGFPVTHTIDGVRGSDLK